MFANDVRVFIRFTGRSKELDRGRFGVDRSAGDNEVRRAVASFLDVDVLALESATIERTKHGFVVKPKAIFG